MYPKPSQEKQTQSPHNSLHKENEQQEASYITRMINGRLNRKSYAIGSLLTLIPPFILILIEGIVLAISPTGPLIVRPIDTTNPVAVQQYVNTSTTVLQDPIISVFLILTVVYSVLLFPFSLSLQVRRLHDFNQSGWLMLVNFIPIINYIFPLYVALYPGTDGKNNYGEKPPPEVKIKEDILQLR